ncbi:MAG: flagellar hook basal-body protein [Myxococcota bacterium]
MASGIYVATSGAVARQNQLEIVANNLANVDTDGFREQQVSFQEVLVDEVDAPNRRMVALGRTYGSQRQGSLKTTNNPRDLAIEGTGHFVVGTESGQQLTRALTLQLSPRGDLQDAFGRRVFGETGPIILDDLESVRVDRRGQLVRDGEVLDRIRTVDVANPSGLQPTGLGLQQPTQESGGPFLVEAQVVAGALESSNVNALESMVQLVQLQREYQTLSRAISSYREAEEGLIEAARS